MGQSVSSPTCRVIFRLCMPISALCSARLKLELPGGNYFLANEIVTKDNVQQFLVREERFRG